MLFRSRRQDPPAMTLEGVLGPNDRLDDAAGMAVAAPDALCVTADGRLLASSGRQVIALAQWGGRPGAWASFDGPVTALCCSPGGLVAIGMTGGRVAVHDMSGKPMDGWTLPAGSVVSVVDIAFLSEDELVLVDSGYGAHDNVLSLAAWDDAPRGRLVALRRSGAMQAVASDLHCPMGICVDVQRDLLVPLFERAGIVDVAGRMRQSGYPGYLGRLHRTATGYVMACLSRRDPLIEFLKTEHAFVAEMKAKIEPRHWIAPRATPEFSHDFPIELGATRLFGEVKPWAPSFSYGLVIEMDDRLMPVGAAHSRASGTRHAISDVVEWNGDLLAVSRASGEILKLSGGA